MADHSQGSRATALALQALIDKEAIRNLVLCYSRAVDRQDFAFLRTLYIEDAIEEDHGGAYSGSAEGYVDWLTGVMGRVQNSSHMVHNHMIALDGPDRAQGEVYLSGHTRLALEQGGFEDLTHGMRYLDRYAKSAPEAGGVWRFSRRTVIVDWLDAGPTRWDPLRPDTRDAQFGAPGPADPSYIALDHPLFRRRD